MDINDETLEHCFLPPPNEINIATRLVDAAADAFLRQEHELARSLLRSADIPSLRDYRANFVGTNKHPRVVMTRQAEWAARHYKREERDQTRMPAGKSAEALFKRDGWRCRYCGIRVASLKAFNVLNKHYYEEIRWRPGRFSDRNIIFNIIAGSLDHVLPHARGGESNDENLVTACGGCNYGKKSRTLIEVGLADPRHRSPIRDRWDGLTRVLDSHEP